MICRTQLQLPSASVIKFGEHLRDVNLPSTDAIFRPKRVLPHKYKSLVLRFLSSLAVIIHSNIPRFTLPSAAGAAVTQVLKATTEMGESKSSTDSIL